MGLNRSASIDILATVNKHGASTPKLVINEMDLNESYIRLQLRELDEAGYVERPARGLYTVTEKGLETIETGRLVEAAEH